jgi:hypothetical protein
MRTVDAWQVWFAIKHHQGDQTQIAAGLNAVNHSLPWFSPSASAIKA